MSWVETTDSDLLTRSGAWLSEDGQHRYRLWREWDQARPSVAFVMLNPSTADAMEDDPTIRKCVGFAKRWGYGRIDVVNLWSYRSTDWRGVLGCPEPSPRENHAAWVDTFADVLDIIAAWGAHRQAIAKKPFVGYHPDLVRLARGRTIRCLGRSKSGEPRHPLMLAYDTEREPWAAPVPEGSQP